MARRPQDLPQLGTRLFLTVMAEPERKQGADTAFTLLRDAEHTAALHTHYSRHVELARAAGLGLILESPTWRASQEHGQRLGYDSAALERVNRQAIALLEAVRAGAGYQPLVIAACLGPLRDHVAAQRRMSITQARRYHAWQVRVLADTHADLLCAVRLDDPEEAIGIALAARHAQMPLAIGFSVGDDGRLAAGQTLGEAIEQVDLQTDGYPLYYRIDCAQPAHVDTALLDATGAWRERVRGLQLRSEPGSDTRALARQCAQLRQSRVHLTIFGGLDPLCLDALLQG